MKVVEGKLRFIDLCVKNDKLTFEQINEMFDDFTDEWHKGNSKLPFHEFLGLTWAEYSKLGKPENIMEIIENRRKSVS